MKKLLISILLAGAAVAGVQAAAPKQQGDTTIVVTVTPTMHCVNCEKKIKSNIRFVKGVKSIETDRAAQTVTIRADKAKLVPGQLEKEFKKIGYTVKPVAK